MPTPTKGARLGGSPAHQRMMLANLATSLFEHGKITTTEAKARRLRPFAERLISKAKRDDLHARRQVLQVIRDKGVVHALFTEIGPNYATRPGGYTRITKLGPRKGDNAPMAVIELVEAREFAARDGSATRSSAATPAATPTETAQGGSSETEPVEGEPVDGEVREEEAGEVDKTDDAATDDAATDDAATDDAEVPAEEPAAEDKA